MLPVGIILLLTHAVDILAANSTEPIDCIVAEEKCQKDSGCRVSYRDFKSCSQTDLIDKVNSLKCKEAADVLSQNSLMQCKCQRRMKREEHCLNIYWTLHGYLDFYDSPYMDEEIDRKGASEHARLAAESDQQSMTNGCLKEANICSSHHKCSKLKNDYVMHCASMYSSSCDRHLCHNHLREFFKKVPFEFTKKFLFCQCNKETNCAERRRKNIVPECSFEEKVKKNCLELRDSCLNNSLCKSRFLDFQKHCHLFEKETGNCPPESHSHCLHAYIRMIGTVMTPNFINNSTMETSLWCTCEGSGDPEDECKNVLSMFTSNKCLKNAIRMEINNINEMDPESNTLASVKVPPSLTASPLIDWPFPVKKNTRVLSVRGESSPDAASGGSSLDISLTLLSTTIFSLIKAMISI